MQKIHLKGTERIYICRFSKVNASKEKGGQGLSSGVGWNTQEILWQHQAFPGRHFKGHGLGLMLKFGQVSGLGGGLDRVMSVKSLGVVR